MCVQEGRHQNQRKEGKNNSRFCSSHGSHSLSNSPDEPFGPMDTFASFQLTTKGWMKLSISLPISYSEYKAVAAQTPEIAIPGSGGLDADQEFVGSMETALRMALSGMPVLEDRNADASGFVSV